MNWYSHSLIQELTQTKELKILEDHLMLTLYAYSGSTFQSAATQYVKQALYKNIGTETGFSLREYYS